jgi:acyl-CoA dehydrogenase
LIHKIAKAFPITFIEKLVADHMEDKNVVAETSMAKYRTTEAVNTIVNQCMDIIGSFASDEQCPMARQWRDMRVLTIFAGANEIMKTIIVKSLGL